MISDREVTHVVRAWLQDGMTELPSRVMDGLLEQLSVTPQRHGPWPTRRLQAAPQHSRMILATMAALVISMVGAGFLIGQASRPVGPPANASQPIPAGTPAPSATEVPTPTAPTLGSLTHPIDAGLYAIDPLRVPLRLPSISLRVHGGWDNLDGYGVQAHTADPDAMMSVTFWSLARVYLDPCHWRGAEQRGDLADPPLMRSLDGQAEALSDWWRVNGAFGPFAPTSPQATAPIDLQLAGRDAKYVEVTVPPDLDFSACDGGEYRLWMGAGGQFPIVRQAGQVERVWILSVGSDLLAVDASHSARASAADLITLQAIVDSITITP